MPTERTAQDQPRMNRVEYEIIVTQVAAQRFGSGEYEDIAKAAWVGAMMDVWPLVQAWHEHIVGDPMNAQLFAEVWMKERGLYPVVSEQA